MESSLELIKHNADDGVLGLIEGNKNIYPEIQVVPGIRVAGDSYKTLTRETWPEGGFKAKAEDGIAVGKASYSNKEIRKYPYESPMQITKSLASSHRLGTMEYLARIARGHFNGFTKVMGTVFFYGNNSSHGVTNATPGLLQSYDSTNHIYDATGTSAGAATSVWIVRLGEDETSFVFDLDNDIIQLGDWREQQLEITSGKWADGFVNSIVANAGVQVASIEDALRICNLTTQSGKGLTDAVLANAMELMKGSLEGVRIFMNRRAHTQLWNSRSAVGQVAAGAGAFAPRPTDFDGIPITVTDSLVNTEAIVS